MKLGHHIIRELFHLDDLVVNLFDGPRAAQSSKGPDQGIHEPIECRNFWCYSCLARVSGGHLVTATRFFESLRGFSSVVALFLAWAPQVH